MFSGGTEAQAYQPLLPRAPRGDALRGQLAGWPAPAAFNEHSSFKEKCSSFYCSLTRPVCAVTHVGKALSRAALTLGFGALFWNIWQHQPKLFLEERLGEKGASDAESTSASPETLGTPLPTQQGPIPALTGRPRLAPRAYIAFGSRVGSRMTAPWGLGVVGRIAEVP